MVMLATFLSHGMRGQNNNPASRSMLRIYEDNDFINIFGKGTDEAYTNGTRIDYFYENNRKPVFFIDRLLPRAGNKAANTYGWGIMQLMFTPRDISTAAYQPNDYPYSGALFLTHTLYSYNPSKKYNFQTEVMAGVRGPAAFAAQTQKFIHRVIHYQQPMGWQHQLQNKVILNLHFAAEKQLYAAGNCLEVIGGTDIYTGNFVNRASMYPTIRIGKMNPYFEAYISQYTGTHKTHHRNNMQLYFIFKPAFIFTLTNGLLQSDNKKSKYQENDVSADKMEKAVYALDAGAVLAINRFSISFIQNFTSAMMEHLYTHQVGNITLYFSW